jgi:hypothetical protein
MTGTPLDLLTLVRAGVGLLTPSKAKVTPEQADGASFASLLRQAEQGTLSSGREVTVGKGVEVKLDREQLARLSAAADRAEASGAVHALVMMDGMALKIDVQARTIVGQADAASGQVLTGIDSVVTIPASGEGASSGAPPILPYPGAGAGMNPSLAKALASRN